MKYVWSHCEQHELPNFCRIPNPDGLLLSRRRRVAVTIGTSALLVGLVSCGGDGNSDGASEEERIRVLSAGNL